MTLTIDLTPTEEANLSAAARQAGLDPTTLVSPLTIQMPFSDVIAAASQGGYAPETWVKHFLLQALGQKEQASAVPQTRVLERFHGTVDHVTDGIVFLTMENDQEVLSSAELTVEQMTQYGLSPDEDFECLVTEQGQEVRVKFAPIPRRHLSASDTQALRAGVDDAFRNFDDDF